MKRIKKIARLNSLSKSPSIRKSCYVSKDMMYHVDNGIEISQNIFRLESSAFYKIFREARDLWKSGSLAVSKDDEHYLGTDLGKFANYNGRAVPLDMPFCYDDEIVKESKKKKKKKKKDPPLGKPKRGGSKKFYVYVKCKGKVKKISFGSPDMPLRVSEPDRRRSFVARHKCKQKKDRCTAGYWSCRIGRYPHLTGAKKKYTWW
jgi:hypothetical protein|tara:strand:- start:700 stop:1311 length:612 start_codon:yes stop_codon:yes gene_type:complete